MISRFISDICFTIGVILAIAGEPFSEVAVCLILGSVFCVCYKLEEIRREIERDGEWK